MSLSGLLVVTAVAVNGLLAGASLDQSVKQLPARKRIGAIAYSAYAQAADLRNGIPLYAALGIGGALFGVMAAIFVWREGSEAGRLPAVLVVTLSVLHTAVTTRAAPMMYTHPHALRDEADLTRIFDRFARWQAYRCTLQIATFAALLWLWAAISAPARQGHVPNYFEHSTVSADESHRYEARSKPRDTSPHAVSD